MYKPILPLLKKGLKSTDSNRIVDLGSGGGGGLLWLNEELKKTIPDLKVVMTDYFPNIEAFERTKRKAENFEFITNPVDAREVPSELMGLRTQFLSLHHFKPKDASRILQNALDTNQPIAIFEAQERSLPSLIAMFFSPITLLLTTPFIKPFKIGRIIFTYLIPLVPLFVWWDGIVSSLRTYSVDEMNDLVNNLSGKERYDWEIGKLKSGPGTILYLMGTAKP